MSWSDESAVQRHVYDFLWLLDDLGWEGAAARVLRALAADIRAYRAPRELACWRLFHVLRRHTTTDRARALIEALPLPGTPRPDGGEQLEVIVEQLEQDSLRAKQEAIHVESDVMQEDADEDPVDLGGVSDLQVGVSGFRGPRDNRPRGARIPWRRLAARLTDFGIHPTKSACPLWTPAIFSGDRRKAEEVVELSCLVLDFDDGATPDEILPLWKGVAGVVHTSWSHGPPYARDYPKWRLVMPLEQPVPAEAWGRVWQWAADRVGQRCDVKCKDAGRIYYVPAVRSERWPREARILTGRPLSVPASLLAPPRPDPMLSAPRRSRRPGRRSELYKTDEGARRELGERLGGQLVAGGTQVKGATCPACSRPSLVWWVRLGEDLKARCNHRKSCPSNTGKHPGFWLDELEA